MARGGPKPAIGQALRPAQDAHLNREVQDLAPHGEVDLLYLRRRREWESRVTRFGRHRFMLAGHHVYRDSSPGQGLSHRKIIASLMHSGGVSHWVQHYL